MTPANPTDAAPLEGKTDKSTRKHDVSLKNSKNTRLKAEKGEIEVERKKRKTVTFQRSTLRSASMPRSTVHKRTMVPPSPFDASKEVIESS